MRMVAAVAVALASFAAEAETVVFPTLPPPNIVDGDLADPCWAKAYRTPPFTSAKEGDEITEATCAYAFCGESALYVAYRCEFADIAPREKAVASSKGAFDCDCVETFIDAGDTGNYAHLAVNVAGDIYKAGFCGDAKATVQLHEKDWTVEIEIPYSSLKLSGRSSRRTGRSTSAGATTASRRFPPGQSSAQAASTTPPRSTPSRASQPISSSSPRNRSPPRAATSTSGSTMSSAPASIRSGPRWTWSPKSR
jgi:hypothetical protein